MFEVNVVGALAVANVPGDAPSAPAGSCWCRRELARRAGRMGRPVFDDQACDAGNGWCSATSWRRSGVDLWRADQRRPYATGFNDRMASDPGDWCDETTAAPGHSVMANLRNRITVGQMDPDEVAARCVELVEAGRPKARQLIRPTS
jgi:hypothetical protein